MQIDPDNTVNRGVVVTTASSFLEKAEIISKQLSSYQTNLNTQIQAKVNRINEIGDSIKSLNKAIRSNESSGQNANDYRDERNALLDELGGLVSITYREDAYGMVNVSVEGVQFVTDDSGIPYENAENNLRKKNKAEPIQLMAMLMISLH